MIVPKGRRASHLVLEDGSKVWVNSGSTFRFPTTFEKNKREVYVDGEIYIEIAKDAERPFFVKTSEMSVRALGTRFNVMAYHDELAQSVVLVISISHTKGYVAVILSEEKLVGIDIGENFQTL